PSPARVFGDTCACKLDCTRTSAVAQYNVQKEMSECGLRIGSPIDCSDCRYSDCRIHGGWNLKRFCHPARNRRKSETDCIYVGYVPTTIPFAAGQMDSNLTFAVTEFFRTLHPECHRGGTNQPPKCTQQHHYHFTCQHREVCFVTVLFVPVCLTERVALLPFGGLTFWQARRAMKICNLSVDHLGYYNECACYKSIHCFRVGIVLHSLPAQQENSQRRFEWKRDSITSFSDHFVTRA
ncbi:Uncharacterized protein DBV15_07602, partial [Temnothorax longispinosus]